MDTQNRAESIEIIEVPWSDPRARALRDGFDAEMNERYGGGEPPTDTLALRLGQAFGVKQDDIIVCLLVLVDGAPAGHGALFRRPEEATVEVRKVVVDPTFRGRGLGHRIMEALESRGRALGATRAILDTGPKQPDSIALYESRGFVRIPVFEPYTLIPNAICFEKFLG